MSLPAVSAPDPAALLSILKVVLGFGLVVFLHELGHFLAARKNGVFVEKFAIGFDFWGLKLASWKSGGTQYVVGAFPLGGYVKMRGQQDSPGAQDDSSRDPQSFQSKSVWQRTQIISAGVIANFLSAFALCWMALVAGYWVEPAVVGSVGFRSLQAGLRPGDAIVRVAGKEVSSWQDVFVAYASQEAGTSIPLEIQRDGQPLRVQVPVRRDPGMPTNMPDFSSPADAAVGWLVKDSPGEKAGLRAADRVVAVDGAPMQSWTEFQQEIRAGAGRDLSLTVERKEDGRTRTLDLVARPEGRSPDLVPKWTLGVEPAQPPVLDFVDEGSPAWEAGLRAGDRVLAVAGQPVSSWYGLWRAATWDAPGDAPLRVSAVRGDAPPFETSLRPGPLRDWNMGVSALPRWGVAGEPVEGLELGNVAPGSPAERGGLRPGDVVTKLSAVVKIGEDSKDWEADDPSWEALLATLNALAGPEIELSVRREGKGEPVALTLRPVPEPRPESIGYLGVGAQSRQEMLRMGPLEAVVPAMAAPFRILSDFVDGIRAMLLRRVSAKMVAGPIGILQATYASAKQSFGNLLNFLSLLSVNLAVVNFLPIPVTDGGHFVFLMYERWKGRRMDEALEARLQWAGLLFILAIFLFATWNDIARIVGGSFGL